MSENPVIQVEGLSKIFRIGFWMKQKPVLSNVSFSIQKGECVGFLGPNGAGKTTTLKCILGLLTYEHGRIQIMGKDAHDSRARASVGFMPDNPYFYDHLKGEEFLDFIGRLHSLSGAARRRKIDELMELVGLSHARKLELRKYSKGMLQRIGIAQCLINDPEIAIFDEPMEGLDPIGRKEVRDLLRRLNREQGKTVFFSTHILPDIEVICDRVIIIAGGELQGAGLLSDLLPPGIQSWEVCFRSEAETSARRAVPAAHPDPASRNHWLATVSDSQNLQKALASIQETPGIEIVSITPQRRHIEDLFYEKFGSGKQEAVK